MSWLKFKTWIGSVGSYLYLRFVYRRWSRVYRFLWCRKYRACSVSTYETLSEVVDFTSRLIWKADSWKEMFDAIATPEQVEYIGRYGNKKVGDCDEFAIYLANALEKSKRDMVPLPGSGYRIGWAHFLTIPWIDKDGKYGGHNVCLITWTEASTGRIIGHSYMDYGYPSPAVPSIVEVVKQVMSDYAPGGTVLACSIHDKDLNLSLVARSL